MPLSEVGRSIRFGEARDLIDELGRESGSHLVADLKGYDRYAASEADVAALILAEDYRNLHRDTKRQKQPYDFGRPWSPKDPNADVTPERRAELVEQLRQRSVFRDRD